MRHSHNASLDTDGLQADVMRFMAIIAFCLIAILALVEKIEPGKPVAVESDPEPVEAQIEVPEIAFRQPPSREAFLPPEQTVSAETEDFGMPPDSAIEADSSPEASDIAQTTSLAHAQENGQDTNPYTSQYTSQYTSSDSKSDTSSDTIPDTSNNRSLTLRFDSDAVFLKLIASEDIQLFVRNESGFQQLTSNFATTHASPSGQLYEVFETSIPERVTRLFTRASSYLVQLPVHTRNEITRLRNAYANQGGELVIQRNGDVIHES